MTARRRLLAVLTSASLALSVAACNGEDNPPATDPAVDPAIEDLDPGVEDPALDPELEDPAAEEPADS